MVRICFCDKCYTFHIICCELPSDTAGYISKLCPTHCLSKTCTCLFLASHLGNFLACRISNKCKYITNLLRNNFKILYKSMPNYNLTILICLYILFHLNFGSYFYTMMKILTVGIVIAWALDVCKFFFAALMCLSRVS